MNRTLKAARAIAKLINENLALLDADVHVVQNDGRVSLVWESGPFEWALQLAAGECVLAAELGEPSAMSPWQQQVQPLCNDLGVYLEANNSFTVNVWED